MKNSRDDVLELPKGWDEFLRVVDSMYKKMGEQQAEILLLRQRLLSVSHHRDELLKHIRGDVGSLPEGEPHEQE